MAASISRQYARWSAKLTYDTLPASVVEKVKSLLLLHLVAGLLGQDHAHTRRVIAMVEREEAHPAGASIFGRRVRVTRSGAVLANSEILHSAGLYDSFRMLTHPGPVLIACALTNAELGGNSVPDVIAALAAGYEFECRLADDFVPAVAARGFRPAPVFSTMGGSLVAGKLLGLSEDELVSTIAIAANSASGLNESGRTGSGDILLHEPNAARQATFAAVAASMGYVTGSEEIIEGAAGFLRAFAGATSGQQLPYVFDGPRNVDLEAITRDLGASYAMLDVMFRIYPISGYNQPVIELMSDLVRRHEIAHDDIEQVVVQMNYLETLYPSPEFPRFPDVSRPRQDSTPYYAAYAAVHGGYPVAGAHSDGHPQADQAALRLMPRIRLIGTHGQPMFSPEISVYLRDGTVYHGALPYARLLWGFDELASRLQPTADSLPGGQQKLDHLIDLVRHADALVSVQPLLEVLNA
jgi:2-methylcitrate dehydratase PrpD